MSDELLTEEELREKIAEEVGVDTFTPDYWRADRILKLLADSGWKSPKEVEEIEKCHQERLKQEILGNEVVRVKEIEEAIKQEREKILNWIKENYPLS